MRKNKSVVKRETTFAERFGEPVRTDAAGGKLSYGGVKPQLLALVISAVTDCGDAIVFARTRDGGALAITVLAGEERKRLYGDSVGEITDQLNLVRRAYGQAPQEDLPDDKVG
jgi:hypothetical protein